MLPMKISDLTDPENMTESVESAPFVDPILTAKGDERAWVSLTRLETLWFNTGTLCNLACANCYIESTPKNDRLVYLSTADILSYLDEIEQNRLGTATIGLTGGEPFMNPDILDIMSVILSRGYNLLVLTNAMLPMQHKKDGLRALHRQYGKRLRLRVSIDHYAPHIHEKERGPRSFTPAINGLKWLSDNGFQISVAGRTFQDHDEDALRKGYAALFTTIGIALDAHDEQALILFPEMDENKKVPEITTHCWRLLGINPDTIMCATSRMVVKYKGASRPSVQACTLLAYDQRFAMGETLKEAAGDVRLNHPHCSKFCVLGGSSCSG